MLPQPPDAPPPRPPQATSQEHIRLVGILHYVMAGLYGLMGCLGFFHLIMGIMMLTNTGFMSSGGAPPPFIGGIFAGAGAFVILWHWVLGALNVMAGRNIAARRGRTFCLVIAGFNCTNVPLGTVLGVFTFLLLLKEDVARDFR